MVSQRVRAIVVLLPIVVLLIVASRGDARPRRLWTYKSLWSEAEVVCLASVKSTKPIGNKEFEPDYLDRYESTLAIRAVLKGEPELGDTRFVHYKYKRGVTTLGNGPTFPDLGDSHKADGQQTAEPDRPRTRDQSAQIFLFFLKRRPDGTYGPVSGDKDAELSVARVEGYADEE